MNENAPTEPAIIVEPFPPSPVCWPTLTAEQADEHRANLATWLEWLVDRYALDHRTVPACWHEHGALVEELSALHGAWRAAYAQTAPAGAPLDWQTNFHAGRERLHQWVSRSGCRPGEHRVGTSRIH